MSSQLFVVFRGLYPVAPPYVISVVRIHRIWRRAEPLAPIDGIVLLDVPAPRCEVACACGPSNIHWYWNICKAPKAWRASSGRSIGTLNTYAPPGLHVAPRLTGRCHATVI